MPIAKTNGRQQNTLGVNAHIRPLISEGAELNALEDHVIAEIICDGFPWRDSGPRNKLQMAQMSLANWRWVSVFICLLFCVDCA
jgi:hypothetical protein